MRPIFSIEHLLEKYSIFGPFLGPVCPLSHHPPDRRQHHLSSPPPFPRRRMVSQPHRPTLVSPSAHRPPIRCTLASSIVLIKPITSILHVRCSAIYLGHGFRRQIDDHSSDVEGIRYVAAIDHEHMKILSCLRSTPGRQSSGMEVQSQGDARESRGRFWRAIA